MRRLLRWLFTLPPFASLATDRDMPMVQFWVGREARAYGDPYGHESRSR